ncbi:MAG: M23 family metallopeptidase [Bacteroidales bacterium]
MKRVTPFTLFALSTLLLSTILCCTGNKESSTYQEREPDSIKDSLWGLDFDSYTHYNGRVERGDYFTKLITKLGGSYQDGFTLATMAKESFNPKELKLHHNYKALYTKEENPQLKYLIYEKDPLTSILFTFGDSLSVKEVTLELESKLKIAKATIESSLWNDMVREGIEPTLALKLSEIYAWSIDFFALQRGDSFEVLYNELFVGDKFYDIGEIYAVSFNHMGTLYDAFLFSQDEGSDYWNREGENLQKAFLKAPLNFTRISSGFSYGRRHPVTRVVRPHTGVDYAAPTGTPVRSIGDGVVIQRGYYGGGGNTIKIKHNSVYTTAYLHLSRFAKGLVVGKRVKQGEVIGFVGSTGISTGPHLDFRVWKNGSPINPLKMESPPAKPLKEENREPFERKREEYSKMKDSLLSQMVIDSIFFKIGFDYDR